ncbi:MAG: FxLYD domain-containing protein [Rhodothermales bacterium]
MSFDEEHILQDYIARLLTMQDERDEWLDDSDLKKAAMDLGLSPTDLQRIDEAVEAHRQRGKNFSQHGVWDEAIAEYRQAAVLRPFDVSLIHELAVAHASRWQASRDTVDRDDAERYARRCIELDPNHHPSYELLTALKHRPKPPGRRAGVIAIVAMAAVVMVLGILVYLFLGTPPAPPLVETPLSDGPLPSEMQIPVHLLDTADPSGLHLDVQRSIFKRYDDSYSYTLHANVLNEESELHRLRMKMTLIGEAGDVLHTDYFDIRSDYQPYLRPGDTAPIAKLVFEKQPPPPLQQVELSVDIIEREPAAADYGTPTSLPLDWDFFPPDYLDFEVFERESRITSGIGERMHFLTLAVRNNGTRSVQYLRVKVTWYDAQDGVITSELAYVVPSTGPALRSGETWVVRAIGKFPEGDTAPFARYAVSVVEAE